ncbi:unnamed protein product, partial [Orchesella dallaii]
SSGEHFIQTRFLTKGRIPGYKAGVKLVKTHHAEPQATNHVLACTSLYPVESASWDPSLALPQHRLRALFISLRLNANSNVISRIKRPPISTLMTQQQATKRSQAEAPKIPKKERQLPGMDLSFKQIGSGISGARLHHSQFAN